MLADKNTPNTKRLVLAREDEICNICAEPLAITVEDTGCGDPVHMEEIAECPNGCTLINTDSYIL